MKDRDIKEPVPDWRAAARPAGLVLEGRYVRLAPLQPGDAAALHAANVADDRIWDFLPYGPFADAGAYRAWVETVAGRDDPFFLSITARGAGGPSGVASWLRIKPEAGSIEVGHINLSAGLQRTRAATEAMFLMMRWAFEAGYRRYEWKCDAANLASRRAAQRLGLSFEGVFRQALVVKGRNRDTAWFAAIDKEWPALQAAFERWLDLANFARDGSQRLSLSDLTAPILAARDPALHQTTLRPTSRS